jgi:hypothetical protein
MVPENKCGREFEAGSCCLDQNMLKSPVFTSELQVRFSFSFIGRFLKQHPRKQRVDSSGRRGEQGAQVFPAINGLQISFGLILLEPKPL